MNKKRGRPSIRYPYLWQMYHILWEKGEITQKDMMDNLNLKKATLYKLSKQYKKEIYQGKNKNIQKIDYEEKIYNYMLRETDETDSYCYQIFHINYKKMKEELELTLSTPTILKILKVLEDKRKISKVKRGTWRIL